MKHEEIIDIRGIAFEPLKRPFRVVSLVPSWTETLFDLGLAEAEIVGRTEYCIRPRSKVARIENLGGPRDPDVERILELDPDLVVADREENRREDVEEIERHWGRPRVFVTGPRTIGQALQDIELFGLLFRTRGRARQLIEAVRSWMAQLVRQDRGTVVYLVWEDPWMAASGETYIGDVLRTLGYRNLFEGSAVPDSNEGGTTSYPVVTVEDLVRFKPEAVFLSTEPFPFRKSHTHRLRSQFRRMDPEYGGKVDVRIVNGEYFSWYGSRMIPAFRYFVKHQGQR